MFVIVAGAGRTGTQLTLMLMSQGYKVHLIDNRNEVLSRIHRELPTEDIFEGDPTDPEVLEHAGIRDAQVLAACLPSDEVNLSLCYFARERYQVPRTIARMNNPRNAWLFDDKFHVDVALNQAAILARLIEEEMSMGDMMTLMKLRRGNYSVVEEKIPEVSRAIGKAIKDLALPERVAIAAIIRNGEVIVPRGVTTLEAGDEVLAVTDHEGAEELEKILGAAKNIVSSKP